MPSSVTSDQPPALWAVLRAQPTELPADGGARSYWCNGRKYQLGHRKSLLLL